METLKAAKLSLFNNIAMCATKMEDWKLAKEVTLPPSLPPALPLSLWLTLCARVCVCTELQQSPGDRRRQRQGLVQAGYSVRELQAVRAHPRRVSPFACALQPLQSSSDTKGAWAGFHRYEEALADLGTAASHAPEDKNVIKATARVKKLQKKQEDKEKKMCGCLAPSPVRTAPCCAAALANGCCACGRGLPRYGKMFG